MSLRTAVLLTAILFILFAAVTSPLLISLSPAPSGVPLAVGSASPSPTTGEAIPGEPQATLTSGPVDASPNVPDVGTLAPNPGARDDGSATNPKMGESPSTTPTTTSTPSAPALPFSGDCTSPDEGLQTYWNDPGKEGPWAFGPPGYTMYSGSPGDYIAALGLWERLCGNEVHGPDHRLAAALNPFILGSIAIQVNGESRYGAVSGVINGMVARIQWDQVRLVPMDFGDQPYTLQMVGTRGSENPTIQVVEGIAQPGDLFLEVPFITDHGVQILYARVACGYQPYVRTQSELPPQLLALVPPGR